MQTDWSIGEVMNALDQHGLAENTLLIVTSDNGCSPQADFPALLAQGHNPSHVFRGHKADIFDGLAIVRGAVVEEGTTEEVVFQLLQLVFEAIC